MVEILNGLIVKREENPGKFLGKKSLAALGDIGESKSSRAGGVFLRADNSWPRALASCNYHDLLPTCKGS